MVLLSVTKANGHVSILSFPTALDMALHMIMLRRAPVLLAPLPSFICAWCPGFDPALNTAGASHGICPACIKRLEDAEQLAADDAREVEREEQAGSRCGAACGYCGRCS